MSDTVKTWIEERRSIQAKATIGEWDKRGGLEWEGSLFGANGNAIGQTWGIFWREDQTAIVDAHNNLPRALNALNAVLELHKPVPHEWADWRVCAECCSPEGGAPIKYPCSTIEAIEGAINE